ncbi:hypothetical protein FHL15_005246 [Xylaria flabelliformis]|uniref:Uncharacterized protein n=1 Tax=Xylaria flabelliformis TaxID=2512241 RepID=A0A553I0Y2_9PEZI|nr:hypothetical protein FHL15_005246 [Xylaria flabelliformis]
MGLPFQCLSPLGWNTKFFCAAKGCSIQTFNLDGGSQPLFSWTHPSLQQAKTVAETKETTHGRLESEEQTRQQPPSKRRKLGSDEADAETEAGQGTPAATANGEKNQKKGKANWAQPKPEAPLIVLLTATADGSHVIAVTGQDKTLWVFEHDGKGSLEEVSRRAMPKRPCSLALAADGRTILSADKFGDVYALPLVPDQGEDAISTPALASSTQAPTSSQPLRGANVFTVHSQRNRRALEDQQRQRETNAKRDLPKEGPKFAHEVLLGHVSMLTSVLTAKDANERPYIITADRDEHIRVSRGIPQSHVIETYCLGHGSFVNTLCIHPSKSGILISGGGDNELFVWNWLAGELLCTVDLLVHVRKVLPDATRLAVVKLVAFPTAEGLVVAAICERVPAFFIFQLDRDNTLSHKETVKLCDNPLDITMLGTEQFLLAAIDAVESDGEVSVFERGHSGGLLAPRESIQGTISTEVQPILSRDDLDKALYTVENLRKTDNDGGEEAAPDTLERSPEIKLD